MSSSVPTYALKFTLPRIPVNMGFMNTNAQPSSAPSYAAGAMPAVAVTNFADGFSRRVPFIVGPQPCPMTAYAVLLSFSADIADNVALCYTFVHVATISVYPIVPGANTKSAMGISLVVAVGNCSGIIGSLIFLGSESPRY